jgi:hypothetical protein
MNKLAVLVFLGGAVAGFVAFFRRLLGMLGLGAIPSPVVEEARAQVEKQVEEARAKQAEADAVRADMEQRIAEIEKAADDALKRDSVDVANELIGGK